MRLTAALMALYLALTAALAIGVDRRFLINDVIAILIFTLLIGGMAIGARWSESPPPDSGPDEPPPPDGDGGWTPPPAPLPSSDRLRQSRHGQSPHRGDALARHRSHRSHQHRSTRAGA